MICTKDINVHTHPHPLQVKAKTAVGKSHGTLRMLTVCDSKMLLA